MRILVVEDEVKIAQAIKKGLEHERYAVDTAADGLAGFDLATSEQYDVIILDLMLPKMDGMGLCRKLRAQQLHTPILMLTAKSQLEDKVAGFNAGADDYLTKSFAFAELLARVKALTRRPTHSNGTVLQVGDLKLDTTNYEVQRAGKQIHLSHKEFTVLEYLLQHKHQVVTKEQIIAHVWDYAADVMPNSVEVYIRHLRTKIDQSSFGQKLIHTAKGFGGYKLTDKSST